MTHLRNPLPEPDSDESAERALIAFRGGRHDEARIEALAAGMRAGQEMRERVTCPFGDDFKPLSGEWLRGWDNNASARRETFGRVSCGAESLFEGTML